MEEDPLMVVNLLSIRRAKSRPRELRTPAIDCRKTSGKLLKRPFSGEFRSSTTFTKIEVPQQFSRRQTNLKTTVNQIKIKQNQPFDDDKLNPDLISTSSTFQPPTLKQIIGVTAQSFCVMTKQTKKIICQHNMSSKRQIASLTKMMTAYTVIHLSKEFNIDMSDTNIRVQKEAAQLEGTTAGLRLGDQLTIIDLLHGMMLPSGNDAAVALAQYFGKLISFSIKEENNSCKVQNIVQTFQQKRPYYDANYSRDALRLFMFKMNYIASHELKLKDTYFANPTGLQHYRSFSTAYDSALMGLGFLESSILQQISSKKIYQCQIYNQKLTNYRTITWRNTNSLLWKRKDCVGLKTGYTPWAGACLATVFNLKDQNLIVVVLKSSSKEQRFSDADKLYQWYRRNR